MARYNERQYAAALEDARRRQYPYLSAEDKARQDAEDRAAWEAESRLYDLNEEPRHGDLRAIKRAFPTRLPLVLTRLRARFSSEEAWLKWLNSSEEERFRRLLTSRSEEVEAPQRAPAPQLASQPETPKNQLELERETERLTGETTARVLCADYGIPQSTLGDLLRKWRDARTIEEAAPQRMKAADVVKVRALLDIERQKRSAKKTGF